MNYMNYTIFYNDIIIEYEKTLLVKGIHNLSLPVQPQIFLHDFPAASKLEKFFVCSK